MVENNKNVRPYARGQVKHVDLFSEKASLSLAIGVLSSAGVFGDSERFEKNTFFRDFRASLVTWRYG